MNQANLHSKKRSSTLIMNDSRGMIMASSKQSNNMQLTNKKRIILRADNRPTAQEIEDQDKSTAADEAATPSEVLTIVPTISENKPVKA